MTGDPLIFKSFRIGQRIAVGGFGVVSEGVGPNGEQVAIKRELASEKVARPILEHEYHILGALAGHECIVDAKAYGREGAFNILVMDLLGPSLSDRFRDCAKRFGIGTTARLALGMLDAIEHIHSRGFIHRDIKPENFLLGRGAKASVVHPVDFGLARRWRHVVPGTRVLSSNIREDSGVIGTLPFASVHAHLGQEQTRRDDLHGLVYTTLLFARGSLPWEDIRGGTRTHCARRILEKKRTWSAARLCKGLPHELEEFSSYCFGVDLNEEPDYHFLRDKLNTVAEHAGWNADSTFEWEKSDWEASRIASPTTQPAKIPPLPHLNRGHVVLLRVSPEKTLDYESVPRVLDPSFFPHRFPTESAARTTYRPAVIQRVVVKEDDPQYFGLEVFPLTLRDGLGGLSKRRSCCFRQLDTIAKASIGLELHRNDVYVYQTSLSCWFWVEYNQAIDITCDLSMSEDTLSKLESELKFAQMPFRDVYDSDDDETRATRGRLPKTWYSGNYVMEIKSCRAADLSSTNTTADCSGVNGWIPDMLHVEELRDLENGGTGVLNDDSDSDSDEETTYWDWPRAENRRLSCTVDTPPNPNPAAA